jgi:hypothetical protein
MPSGGHALAALGSETDRVVTDLLRKDPDQTLFTHGRGQKMKALASALEGWQDDLAAKVVSRYLGDLGTGNREPDIEALL